MRGSFYPRHQGTGLSYSIQSCKFPREDKLKDKNTQDDSKRSDKFSFLNLWRELFVPYSFVIVLHGSKTPSSDLARNGFLPYISHSLSSLCVAGKD